MEWLQSLDRALRFMEENLEHAISMDELARRAYSSGSHFQRVFNIVTGLTVGEYIRNRRLSEAGRALLGNSKVIDVALKYQYETPESFSKAFARFHGLSPSEAKRHPEQLRYFHPLTVTISIQGGFSMSQHFLDQFCWNDTAVQNAQGSTATERYHQLVDWAGAARRTNPNVFDEVTEWIQDDAEWTEDKLAENRQILMQGVLARFQEQNSRIRRCLKELAPSGVVNEAVFKALDQFDAALAGRIQDEQLSAPIARVFADFSVMRLPEVRRCFAGNRTGPTGTNSVKLFGYINILKNLDAGVQWALFMPEVVAKQQKGFQVASFEYRTMPALRFIGREGEAFVDINARKALFAVLDGLEAYRSGFDYDLLFCHHNGGGVDKSPWHGCWGRLFKADSPVPEGYEKIDLIPINDGGVGAPYISQFAYAVYAGDTKAMHRQEGFDVEPMYDVTRNIMLAQGVTIPYPSKYWTAEVFPDGCDQESYAYLFSTEFDENQPPV